MLEKTKSCRFESPRIQMILGSFFNHLGALVLFVIRSIGNLWKDFLDVQKSFP